MPARVTILCGPARSGKTERGLVGYRDALRRRPIGSALWLAPTWRAAAEVRGRLLDGSLAGCFRPNVMTFGNFAETVLHAAGLPIRPMTRLMKRDLVRQIIFDQASRGRLTHFRSIAKTAGLVDLVCEFISELKRLEIWPDDFRRACASRGLDDRDVELSEIYDVYQQTLREHGLFDAEGRFWSARDVLQKGEEGKGEETVNLPSPFGREAGGEGRGEESGKGPSPSALTLACSQRERGPNSVHSSLIPHPSSLIPQPLSIVVDGFTDFTRTQHEILVILASRGEEMLITLPLEATPARDANRAGGTPALRTDLFTKPLKTLDQLRQRHPRATIEQVDRPTTSPWPAMAHLEQTLFQNPRCRGTRASEVVPSPDQPSVGARRGAGGEGKNRENNQDLSQPALTLTLSQRERGPSASLAPRPSPLASRPSSPAPPPNIEILAAARQVGEIELIAARIKRLLVDHEARPGDVVVVLRSPQDLSRLIDEVFDRFGIPFILESGQTLDHSPALRALVALLQLDLHDWPFDRLLAVLRSNYFQPNWPEWRAAGFAAVERTIRDLQIPRGRQSLIDQLAAEGGNSTRQSTVGGDSCRRSASGDASYNASSLKIIRRIADAFDALPKRATLPDWGKAWTQLAEQTGLLRALGEGSEFLPDRRAWDRLTKALEEGNTLAKWTDHRPPEFDRRAALDALVDIIGSDRVGHSGDESGCVRVLSAESVRSLRIPYLFLAGLSEKAFPPADREDRLYSEADYLRLIDAGLPLVARTERAREEMLLFYEAVTRATKRLYLSYPALDEAAQPLLSSPFLSEIEEAFGPGTIPRLERSDLSPIPSHDEPLCQSDFRVKALANALAGNVSLLAALMRDQQPGARGQEPGLGTSVPSESLAEPSPLSPLPSLTAGLELIWLRQDHDHFGPAEGMLQSPEARAYLAARFHPQHVFAATELERYASCPFRFFLERILKIEPVEDLTLEFDVLERGRIVHDVLAAFHQQVNATLGRPGSSLELDEADFNAMLDAAIQESLPPDPRNPVRAALREVDRRLVVEWLSQYRRQVERYDDQWQGLSTPMAPELFEASFGRGDEPSPTARQPFECVRHGRTIRLSGRIDRVDTGTIDGQTVFNVIDYKTGGPIKLTPESIRAGTTLQLPLYAIAAMELLLTDRDALPWRAGYWYVRDDGFKPRQALVMYEDVDGRIELNRDWEDVRDELGDIVAGLIESICAGQFPACSADDRCTGHCPFSTVCRVNQVRSLEKTWRPTANK
jgi:ATP-dependent helicase/nuclease subunit B